MIRRHVWVNTQIWQGLKKRRENATTRPLTPSHVVLICNERCRRTQERAHSRQGHGRTDLVPNLCGNVHCNIIFHWPMWTHFFYYILAIRLFHRFLSQLWFWHQVLQTLLTLDNCRYQTHTRHVTKIQLLIRKHHIIPLAKLQKITNWYIRFDYQV